MDDDDEDYEMDEDEDEDDEQETTDEGERTDAATDYGSTFEADSDYTPDEVASVAGMLGELSVPAELQANPAPEGLQPFEVARQERRKQRTHRAPAVDEQGSASEMDWQPSDDGDSDGGGKAPRRKGQRRRQGYGRRARQRRPTKISRGTMPPQGVDLMKVANTRLISGDFQEAQAHLLQCIKLYPNFTEPYMTLVAVFREQGQWSKALHVYAMALHMKPSDSAIALECANMSAEHGYLKQAIWAWTKYIRHQRGERYAHCQRVAVYEEYLAQQEAHGKVLRLARMATEAVRSMLRTFPGDAFAAMKLPLVLYKAGRAQQAIDFLQTYMVEYPSNVDATHVNMLAQLLLEEERFAECLAALDKAPAAAGGRQYPDIVVKRGVCKLKLGQVDAGVQDLLALCGEGATEFHDLFVEACGALAGVGALPQATPVLSHYLESVRGELEAAAAVEDAADDGAPAAAPHQGGVADLTGQLLEMLPLFGQHAAAAGDRALALSAHALSHQHVAVDHAEFVKSTLDYITLLAPPPGALPDAANQRRVEELLAELDAASDLQSAHATLEVQVRRAEAYIQAGDERAFVQCMTDLVDAQSQLERETKEAMADVLDGLDPALRSRVERMHRGTLGRASAPAAQAASGPEDLPTILDGAPTLGSTAAYKDRRSQANRQLDERAREIVEDLQARQVQVGRRKEPQRLLQLLTHPLLCPLLFKALELKIRDGGWEWACAQCRALLQACPRKTSSELHARNRAVLSMLLLQGRLHGGEFKGVETGDQKRLFSRWPYSMHVWNLFSRCCHDQGSMQTQLVARLLDKNPDSLPLLMMRGHALLVSGKPGAALRCYFQAYQMLPEDSVVNLAIAVAHLSHACSRSVGDRHACVLKAFAFFCRHARFSSNRQEACYNLARAFHHLELNHMAAEWYERSLVLGGAASGADSLAFEAGHNLALIYEGSGAAALAMRTRALYCSV